MVKEHEKAAVFVQYNQQRRHRQLVSSGMAAQGLIQPPICIAPLGERTESTNSGSEGRNGRFRFCQIHNNNNNNNNRNPRINSIIEILLRRFSPTIIPIPSISGTRKRIRVGGIGKSSRHESMDRHPLPDLLAAVY